MPRGQRGAALATSLILLLVTMLLGATTARVTLQGEKAARNEHDFRLAFFAAEAALRDAREDIERDSKHDREALFLPPDRSAFIQGCGRAADGLSHGLCASSAPGSPPVWLSVDLLDKNEATSKTVAYGSVTGKRFASGSGPQPLSMPRYLIELLTPASEIPVVEGEAAQAVFRVTAIGFGMRDSTHVVLQAVYQRERIPLDSSESAREQPYEYGSRRLSWREIPHWQELHHAIKSK